MNYDAIDPQISILPAIWTSVATEVVSSEPALVTLSTISPIMSPKVRSVPKPVPTNEMVAFDGGLMHINLRRAFPIPDDQRPSF